MAIKVDFKKLFKQVSPDQGGGSARNFLLEDIRKARENATQALTGGLSKWLENLKEKGVKALRGTPAVQEIEKTATRQKLGELASSPMVWLVVIAVLALPFIFGRASRS